MSTSCTLLIKVEPRTPARAPRAAGVQDPWRVTDGRPAVGGGAERDLEQSRDESARCLALRPTHALAERKTQAEAMDIDVGIPRLGLIKYMTDNRNQYNYNTTFKYQYQYHSKLIKKG